jgi:hypothetical protein
MHTFTFIDPSSSKPTGSGVVPYLKSRLARLADIATTLHDAGWTVQVSDAGLSFESPDAEEDYEAVTAKLAALGIKEEVSCLTLREINDIVDAQFELRDRVRYDDAGQALRDAEYLRCTSCDTEYWRCPSCEERLERKMAELEQQYGRADLLIADDYERGILHGSLQALQWVLGVDSDDGRCTDADECDGHDHSDEAADCHA